MNSLRPSLRDSMYCLPVLMPMIRVRPSRRRPPSYLNGLLAVPVYGTGGGIVALGPEQSPSHRWRALTGADNGPHDHPDYRPAHRASRRRRLVRPWTLVLGRPEASADTRSGGNSPLATAGGRGGAGFGP